MGHATFGEKLRKTHLGEPSANYSPVRTGPIRQQHAYRVIPIDEIARERPLIRTKLVISYENIHGNIPRLR